MRVDLTRSFSIPADGDEDIDDWLRHFSKGKGRYRWSDLHERRVVVVLGEAGIGKTLEFQNEVERLRHCGKAAFFIPLNQALDKDAWDLIMSDPESRFEQWKTSVDAGFFFLDSVDEARLVSHAAFERALMVVSSGLGNCSSRVHVAISSRITDWAVEGVRDTVRRHLTVPIAAALNVEEVRRIGDGMLNGATIAQQMPAVAVDAFVVSLDPLSRPEAKKLADALGIEDGTVFWDAVEDGDYEFMATRPLDLGWMVNLWNGRRSLGTYLQLIETNVANRLTELNPSYKQAVASPSSDMLRDGAEQLAAATEFSGRPFVSTTESATGSETRPTLMLSDWKPPEIDRLLSSAVFDEATFGRVKFHHRSIREYLAASWVDKQLRRGLPLHRALHLFRSDQFGISVLVPSRRATLCWLAALNVKVREWIAQEFPEMLLFEGDPEAWDLVTANLAFAAYIERIEKGLRTDWWNTPSEFRRLARRLPPGRVAGLLADQQPNSRVTTALLPLVKHGRLQDCGEVVFEMYRRPEASPRERQLALITLAELASPGDRAILKDDLLQGRLQSNELIAAALSAANWTTFAVEQLIQVFKTSRPESSYGTGPMARTVREELLPKADLAASEKLLRAIVGALPEHNGGTRFRRTREIDSPEGVWLLNVLPDCTQHLLSLLPPDSERFPDVCLEAVERMEAMRYSGFVDEDDLRNLGRLVAERPALRWEIALEIAQSEGIRNATNRMTWGWPSGCLVTFNEADLTELTFRANELNTPSHIRDIWFEVGLSLIVREMKGHARRAAFAQFLSGPDRKTRAQRISALRSEWLEMRKQHRQYKSNNREQARVKRQEHVRKLEHLTSEIERIRDGSNVNALHWLIMYSYNHSGRDNLTRVDFDTISLRCGRTIADALASGLVNTWSAVVPPNPADYRDGSLPWDAITGLAGLQVFLGHPERIAALSHEDVARAAQLSVWEVDGAPPWFEDLLETHGDVAVAALEPWLIAECTWSRERRGLRRTLDLALRSPSRVRRRLLQPLVQQVLESRVPDQETLKALLNALREDKLLDPAAVTMICKAKLEASISAEGLVSEIGWLRIWLEEDLQGGWEWFERHVSSLGVLAGKQVLEFASALADERWLRDLISERNAAVLVEVYRLLTSYLPMPGAPASGGEHGESWTPIARLRDSIPQALVQMRGALAHRVLIDLATHESNGVTKEWLHARIMEHAGLEGQHLAPIEPAQLKTLGHEFGTEPRSEFDLFQQALGRLEELRRSLEEGPFSERLFFRVGTPEKHTQLWLAARFLDTTNRRFSVHREEVVDADKRTDVQLSCQYGNVCVEIKPLDRTRRYSAKSLVDTMRTQLVGQYLRGLNSRHGILVLLRLDDKTWAIPDTAKSADFAALLVYLRSQADAIRRDYPQIKELEVLGIDCVG